MSKTNTFEILDIETFPNRFELSPELYVIPSSTKLEYENYMKDFCRGFCISDDYKYDDSNLKDVYESCFDSFLRNNLWKQIENYGDFPYEETKGFKIFILDLSFTRIIWDSDKTEKKNNNLIYRGEIQIPFKQLNRFKRILVPLEGEAEYFEKEIYKGLEFFSNPGVNFLSKGFDGKNAFDGVAIFMTPKANKKLRELRGNACGYLQHNLYNYPIFITLNIEDTYEEYTCPYCNYI